ncbi:hypothetical protein GCM10009718_12580 [Isoptericola halotolerans]|uniref:Septum formation-related domain-containing protein n=1 Tax=Isoptericola halotolerans TaxID=300560 RepID=A0ABX2A2J4_9MICO|nr:septum formation family protein [Isoptericola halotolerans]NOV95821.1 hypothetical protein [Isoptericola halotolerans]
MTDVPDRAEDPLFTSPGPAADAAPAAPAAHGTGAHGTGAHGTGAHGSGAPGPVVGADDPATFGARWGAPGGPTAADRAAARRRARIWVASMVGVIVLVVGVAAGGAWTVNQSRDQAWEPVAADLDETRRVNAVQLVLGSCLADVPDGATVEAVEAVPCAEEHTGQVVGRHDSAVDEVWPGAQALATRVSRTCGPDLLGPSGSEVGSSAGADLSWVVWTPSEESWAQGDRAGLCVAVTTAPRTGSLLE